jgi:predicted site-specific integrase-resolvase
VKLSNWARKQGISYLTAWRWFKAGKPGVVVEGGEIADGLVQDLLEVLTSACGRLYGRRSARNRAKRALEAMGCG